MKLKRPEITIAPLIDCVFLLLIFFAVTSTFSKELGMPINKPKAKTAIPITKAYFIITITKTEQIFLGKEKITHISLEKRLREKLLINPKINVVVASDKGVTCGKLVEIIDFCKEVGATNISIATIPKM